MIRSSKWIIIKVNVDCDAYNCDIFEVFSSCLVKGIEEIEERDPDRVVADVVLPGDQENIQWKQVIIIFGT